MECIINNQGVGKYEKQKITEQIKFDQISTCTGLRHWSNIFENFTSSHLYIKQQHQKEIDVKKLK